MNRDRGAGIALQVSAHNVAHKSKLSDLLSELFDERNEAVTESIATLIMKAHKAGLKTGLCGQAPSDHPDFSEFLVERRIDSISVSPDSFLAVKQHVAAAEARRCESTM